MKGVILGAGYGTRLLQDLQNAEDEELKHLAGIPKPLLPVGYLPLISHWMNAFERSCVSDVYLVTNNLYNSKFEEWAQQYTSVKIVNDGTQKNEERLGATACLQLVIERFRINDHIVVVGGDTLFFDDFSLHDVISKFLTIEREDDQANVVLAYQCSDDETKKYGILETSKNMKVTAMKEKPSSAETESRKACPCFYLFSKNTVPLVQVFLEEHKNASIDVKDAPGHFISWLIPRKPVYAHPIAGRFDVGNLQSYINCNAYFQEKIKSLPNYLH